MALKALYVTSTTAEAEALRKATIFDASSGKFHAGNVEISLLLGNVGAVSTVWSLMNYLAVHGKPDIAINGGIAGSFRLDLPPGSVVMPVTDCFADCGIEDGNEFFTLVEAGLAVPGAFPFENGLLKAPENILSKAGNLIRSVNAITVNAATGSESTRDRLFRKYSPDIETMEGAGFFYVCKMEQLPFIAVRAVSNMVEKRDKSKWNIPLALDNLSVKLELLLKHLNTL